MEKRVKITIGTDAANRCSEELLKLTADLMEKTGVGIHTHALESKTQFIQSMDKYGKTIIDYMDEFGLLGNKSALAHLVWLTDGDIQKCADKGVKMIHSPNALIVGPGFTPLRKYMEAGISVGIGSEGSNLGNLSIFDAMRMVALMQSIYEPNYDRWVSAKETIKMATVGGARIYGGENDFGTLEEGKKADIIFLDMNTPNLKPLGNLINQLVYNENGCSVRHAIVNGKKVLENGKVTLVNEDELLEEANEISKKFRMDNNKLEFIEKQVPYFRKMYFDAMSRDVGLNRFVAPHSEYIRNIPKE
jgi:cytosine/adenosine deaminase-related metal-dependent hydrolase